MTTVTVPGVSLVDRGADTLLTCPGDPSGEAQAAGAWLEVFAVLLSMLHLP